MNQFGDQVLSLLYFVEFLLVHQSHKDNMDFFVLVSVNAILTVFRYDVLTEVGYLEILERPGANLIRLGRVDTVVLSCNVSTILPQLDENLQALQTFVDVDFSDAGQHGSIGFKTVVQKIVGFYVVEKGSHDFLGLLGVVEPFPGESAIFCEVV